MFILLFFIRHRILTSILAVTSTSYIDTFIESNEGAEPVLHTKDTFECVADKVSHHFRLRSLDLLTRRVTRKLETRLNPGLLAFSLLHPRERPS
jgi:hypothetical protein